MSSVAFPGSTRQKATASTRLFYAHNYKHRAFSFSSNSNSTKCGPHHQAAVLPLSRLARAAASLPPPRICIASDQKRPSRTLFTAATMQLVNSRFERLARRIAISGVLTRSEAEQAIREGNVLVDGCVVTENCVVPDSASVVLRSRTINNSSTTDNADGNKNRQASTSSSTSSKAASNENYRSLMKDEDAEFLEKNEDCQFIPPQQYVPKLWALRKPEFVLCDFGTNRDPGTVGSRRKWRKKNDGSEDVDGEGGSRATVADEEDPNEGDTRSWAEIDDEEMEQEQQEMMNHNSPEMNEKANLRDLLDNYRKFDVNRIGEKSLNYEQSDDRLINNFFVVNYLRYRHEGIVLLTNCGRFRDILRNTELCPVETVYDIRLATSNNCGVVGSSDGINGDGLFASNINNKPLSKSQKRKNKIPVSEFPAILQSWADPMNEPKKGGGVMVRGVNYGRIFANLSKRNPEEGSLWIRIRLLENFAQSGGKKFTTKMNPELLVWEHLKTRATLIRRVVWGKVHLSHIPDQTIFPVDMHKHEWLLPFVPVRERKAELVRIGQMMG
ncbi:unnamed protein product [Amoebophrya sp. A120]|nr:unnamed protein product [Amoebophrya sp. A120]|eukprot:GSA120T00015920001.1